MTPQNPFFPLCTAQHLSDEWGSRLRSVLPGGEPEKCEITALATEAVICWITSEDTLPETVAGLPERLVSGRMWRYLQRSP